MAMRRDGSLPALMAPRIQMWMRSHATQSRRVSVRAALTALLALVSIAALAGPAQAACGPLCLLPNGSGGGFGAADTALLSSSPSIQSAAGRSAIEPSLKV